MLDFKELKVEPYEETWRDWFIIDETYEALEVAIISDTDHIQRLNTNPRFQRFKVTGIVNGICLPQFIVWYLFREGEPMQLQSTNGFTRIADYDKDVTTVEFIIKR